MKLKKIISDKKYLFLDRDGVINKRILGGYIRNWNEFEFLPGVLEAMKDFSKHFDRIIIVTNQQGIAKKIMNLSDLENIHQNLIKTVVENKGRVDAIYYCGMLRGEENNCRKPGLVMAKQAQQDFPEIDFSKSIMIGDTKSDMEFAINAGMIGILLENEFTLADDLEFAITSIKTLNELSNIL